MAERSPADAPTRVVIVRHAATEWSAAGRYSGRTDLELSAGGRAEAATIRRILAAVVPEGPTALFSSPLRRALDTCTVALPGVEPTVVDGLAEWDYGSVEGRTAEEVRAEVPGWDLFEHGTPGGESLLQVVARCQAFIAKMERVAAGSTVIAFTHGHLGRVLTALLLDWPPAAAATLINDTASVAVIDLRRGRYVLSAWNRRAV